ncbi:hypothetical protein [Janibacter sp. GS2]|uniref:hypothetical protein n=1 Tax=Janibacter sp. GS2 TaxID=3442646 RepID=UPI003EB888DE
MAKRLTTRLSAGAALVTGLGMVGIATAVPAHAETSLQYACTTPEAPESQTLDFTLDAGDVDTATVGDEVTFTPRGSVTLTAATLTALTDAGVEFVEGSLPAVGATVSDGTESLDVPTDLSIPRTQIQGEATVLALNGTAQTVDAAQLGEYTINAPDSFTANMTGYATNDADAPQLGALSLDCTYVEGSGSQVIDTVTVTEDDATPPAPEPEETDDWFTEPSSLPLVDNVFTVEGEAAHEGTLSVEVVAGTKDEAGEPVPGEVLTTYTWNLTEGANSKDFDLLEGADYVRLVSQDCVDADGNDESVAGGCNVTYRAPWATDGDTGDGDTGDGDTGGDAGEDTGDNAGDGETGDGPGAPVADETPAEPEVPQVVQTDGLTPATPQDDNTAALALGGLLLAGAGAGTVLVARRRAAGQH